MTALLVLREVYSFPQQIACAAIVMAYAEARRTSQDIAVPAVSAPSCQDAPEAVFIANRHRALRQSALRQAPSREVALEVDYSFAEAKDAAATASLDASVGIASALGLVAGAHAAYSLT